MTVTVAGGAVTDIAYTDSETASIGGAALPELVEDALAGKTAWSDAVGGASLTTAAFQDALAQALAQAQK